LPDVRRFSGALKHRSLCVQRIRVDGSLRRRSQ
jgi:hypothetical protein